MVENYKELDSLPELSETFTLAKFLDQFPTYLCELFGASKVALSYVVREVEVPPNPLPSLVAGKPCSANNTNRMDELVEFDSCPEFEADIARVYNLLVHHLAGSAALVSTMRWQRNMDEKEAYKDLVTHTLSSTKREKTIEIGEKTVCDRKWNGRNSRYPLNVHINKHREVVQGLATRPV